jgi:hypothetical protein
MFRASTFVIVLALAGAPAASLARDLWCTSAAAQEHRRMVGCHSEPAGAAGGQTIAAVGMECQAAISGTPFVIELRSQVAAQSIAFLPAAPPMPKGEPTPARAQVFNGPAPGGSQPTVLRI